MKLKFLALACVAVFQPPVSSIYGLFGKYVPVVIFGSIVPVESAKLLTVTFASLFETTRLLVAGKLN